MYIYICIYICISTYIHISDTSGISRVSLIQVIHDIYYLHHLIRGIDEMFDVSQVIRRLQSWMTIKKTEISAQHEFLKPIYLCLHRGIVLIYLDVHQKC